VWWSRGYSGHMLPRADQPLVACPTCGDNTWLISINGAAQPMEFILECGCRFTGDQIDVVVTAPDGILSAELVPDPPTGS
jgi:hypothetical protein